MADGYPRPVTDGGLRERKRTAAMLRIQSVALDLFEQRGFDEVTVEEVAEASEVSPSSIYRYFGTKEQIVLWDEFDPGMGDLLRVALSDAVPLVGLRRAFLAALDELSAEDELRVQRRLRLAGTSPSLEQASIAQSYAVAEMVEQALAQRLGRPVADLEVQVFAHALIGGFLGMFHHWVGTDFREPMREVVARSFEIFEEGLDIVTGPEVSVPGVVSPVSGVSADSPVSPVSAVSAGSAEVADATELVT
jgi:AcrR family transcriptional regulator